MNNEKENVREMFEEVFFSPVNKFFGPAVSEEVHYHLSQARVELLKAMRTFIDSEIEKIEKSQPEK